MRGGLSDDIFRTVYSFNSFLNRNCWRGDAPVTNLKEAKLTVETQLTYYGVETRC
jgi:hypothetical protein